MKHYIGFVKGCVGLDSSCEGYVGVGDMLFSVVGGYELSGSVYVVLEWVI